MEYITLCPSLALFAAIVIALVVRRRYRGGVVFVALQHGDTSTEVLGVYRTRTRAQAACVMASNSTIHTTSWAWVEEVTIDTGGK